jgi:hypothetical protein
MLIRLETMQHIVGDIRILSMEKQDGLGTTLLMP